MGLSNDDIRWFGTDEGSDSLSKRCQHKEKVHKELELITLLKPDAEILSNDDSVEPSETSEPERSYGN